MHFGCIASSSLWCLGCQFLVAKYHAVLHTVPCKCQFQSLSSLASPTFVSLPLCRSTGNWIRGKVLISPANLLIRILPKVSHQKSEIGLWDSVMIKHT
ncbi:hypothetical protein I79_002813 [Cricetulus griseus]|uniref:Secreted protein n=1 Tax=Cricetulus griseus TaxID=10029 RepID=G3GYD8_CRIGR|nr:hypothetical protein I79_002813 [Cricetulus griseus]